MRSTNNQRLFSQSKLVSFIIFLVAIIFTLNGCQTEEQTAELLPKAASSFNCNVRDGFLNTSSSSDVDAIKVKITGIEKQIKELQDNIKTRQIELSALQSTIKSEEIQRLENNIKNLQEQIASLQNDIQDLQNEIKALQNAEKSEEITALENEIEGLQAHVASLQITLNDLQRDLSNASYTGQSMVGYIEYIKIGDTELTGDLSVIEPVSTNQINVVGVISQMYWSGGYAEPIQFSCQISENNKTRLAVLMHSNLTDTDVVFMFTVYDYDPESKSFYKCFHSNSVKLKGLVYKSGGELALSLDTEPSMEVTDPRNFTFSLGVMPQPESQDIHLAVSSTDKFVKKWGVKVQ